MARPIKRNKFGEKAAVRYTAHVRGDWLYITDHDKGQDWEEPLDGWEEVLDLVGGKSRHYCHRDGRFYYGE